MKPELTDQLVREIDNVIALLTDWPASEDRFGWDEPRVATWLKVFTDLRRSVLAGNRPKFVSYLRRLGLDGIGGGLISNAIQRVDQTMLRMKSR
jgi:hypothetical protein